MHDYVIYYSDEHDAETTSATSPGQHASAAEAWVRTLDVGDWEDTVTVECVTTGECRMVHLDVRTVVEVDVRLGEEVENPRAAREGREAEAAAMTEPPNEVWVWCHDGHQWATDGAIAVRRDGPRPASMRDDVIRAWRREDRLPELVARTGTMVLDTGRYHRRMLPLLQTGVVMAMPGRHAVVRGGEVVALVTPWLAERDSVRVVDGRVTLDAVGE